MHGLTNLTNIYSLEFFRGPGSIPDQSGEICVGQCGYGTGFLSEYFRFPLPLSFHLCSKLTDIYMLLLQGG